MTQESEIAARIWSLSRDRILVNLRVLDAALFAIALEERAGTDGIASDIRAPGEAVIRYDAMAVIQRYKRAPNSIIRAHLHILMHCIFSHFHRYERMERDLWDVAADMAAENAVLSLGISGLETPGDFRRMEKLEEWRKKAGLLTAERIYKSLKRDRPDLTELLELGSLFRSDIHESRAQEEDADTLQITQEQWKRLSERIRTELNSFSAKRGGDETLLQNLEEATRETYDYGDFLRRFCVSGEDMRINDDEFDYVYYTYGLSLYGNLPLVEPLEYKDVNKIREFVVAIDTSGSCRGKLAQTFLNKTYAILKSSESFFRKVNIHIIQCDSQVRRDTKITNDDEFEAFMREGQLEGFGATDFRPVFEYVDQAIESGEFENLKGLIYFTDGYGVVPEHKPPYPYDTAFVYLDDNPGGPPTPPWAVKLVLPAEELEDFEEDLRQ